MKAHWRGSAREQTTLKKRKEPKRKSIAMSLMRDVPGPAADKIAMFEKVRLAGGFENEDPVELNAAEDLLRTFAAAERGERGRNRIPGK